MKLRRIHVTEFQSIRDSTPFEVGDITCLVGKNESGKTALLQAIYRLNPLIEGHGSFDVTDDYPRSEVEEYQQGVAAGRIPPATVISATFSLDADEVAALEGELGKGILTLHELTLSKGYANSLSFTLAVNEHVACATLIERAQLPSELASSLAPAVTLGVLSSLISQTTGEESVAHVGRLTELLKPFDESGGLHAYLFKRFLHSRIPRFLYFDEYFLMTGQENIQALQARKAQNKLEQSDYPLLGLIELARIDLDQVLKVERTETLLNKLQGAGNYLSKKILKYWSQNRHIMMEFDVREARSGDPPGMTSGTNIWGRVRDTSRLALTPLRTRSRGFVWFFSFLAWFDTQQRRPEPLILLLDEPGLFLHGRAQADLLTYMEAELKGAHQVVYTTHSPFMVDPTEFGRVRIVQDKSMDTDDPLPQEEEGTKVLTDVLEATEDSLFPLQGALGYDLYQTLFVGPNSLVVDGVSDLLYLQALSAMLSSLGREALSEEWTITPVGGSDKVPTFVALLGAQRGLNIATLIDFQKKDKDRIEDLYKKKLLQKKKVLTYSDFTGGSEGDVEDMLGDDFYLSLVNEEYKSELSAPLSLKKLTAKHPRILVRVEKHLEANPLTTGRGFNHYRPARYLAENVKALAGSIPPEALDRFERAFKALNQIL